MPSFLEVENLSRSYGPRVLFDRISFNINEGDKMALIAPNGTGKSSLLKIIAGEDSSDGDGVVKFMKDITIGFLDQEQSYSPDSSIFEIVYEGGGEKAEAIREYDAAMSSNDPKRIEQAVSALDRTGSWNYENEVKEILSMLRLNQLDRKISELSGGEVKRVAIAAMLIRKPDLIIMDEPTNHLDLESIEFLESYLTRSKCTLLMVTHDRYFLDRVCNTILEMADGTLYRYNGNYSYFLEKKEERINNFNAATGRARNLLRTELDWMRRMPCARGGKAKYRIDAFYDLQERASRHIVEKNIEIKAGTSRLGKKIVDCRHLSYSWHDWKCVDDFSYNFAPGEKVGIVGKNGIGKSTFLDLITGKIPPDSGELEIGATVRFGYYRQKGIEFKEDQTILEAVREIADNITMSDGNTVSASTFLNYFLFPPAVQHTKIEKLSGGEKRRLYLLTVLMKSPNVLILDEPTNDLDIMTLNVLEEYLKDFKGSIVIVSHDRFFLDKIADHLFIFEGEGRIKDFVGSYSGYRQYMKDRDAERAAEERKKESDADRHKNKQTDSNTDKKRKLSFKEQRELEQLEKELETLEKERAELESRLSSGTLTSEELMKDSEKIGRLISEIDKKEYRWLELSDR